MEYCQSVQTHEQHKNTIATRPIGALALRPTGNQQGGYYFYSLMSGQRLHRTHWTELPMPAEVRDRVHALARRARANRGLSFTDSDGNDLDVLYPEADDDNDSDYDPEEDAASDDSSTSSNSDSASDASNDASDDDDENYPDLAVPPTAELAGVDHSTNEPATKLTGVAQPNNEETTGVAQTANVDANNEETSGVDDHPDLDDYVNELEAELDEELAAFDSNYNPATNTGSDRPETSDIEPNASLDHITEH